MTTTEVENFPGFPTCVRHLPEQVPLPSNRLWYRLKVLREAGLIEGTRRGRWIDYALVPGALDRQRVAVPTEPAGGPHRDPAGGCPAPIPVQLRTTR